MATHRHLDVLLADGVIDEVLGRLMSGKEADIYLVRHAGLEVAAKIYKDAAQRSFKNNAGYKEGRGVRNSRTLRAIESGSRFGRDAEEQAWKTAEVSALQLLYRSGVRVPEPIMFYEGVLLMQLVTDADGRPAPRLIDVTYPPSAARELYVELRSQIVRILCCEVIHGDLSPYNILAAAGGPTIIDVPQIVSAAHNSRSEFYFQRDFQNVFGFLADADRTLLAQREDGRKIWQAYLRRELSADWKPSPPREGDPRERDQRGQAPRRGPEQRAMRGPGPGQARGGHPFRSQQGRSPQHVQPQRSARPSLPLGGDHARQPARPMDASVDGATLQRPAQAPGAGGRRRRRRRH